jgi:Transglycosylase SLT domain
MAADAKAIITQAAVAHGVNPAILYGLYGTETGFGADVKPSSAGALGPFQLEPGTARSLGVKNPSNFVEAANGAAKYLAEFKGRGVGGMLSAYNAGPAGGYQAGYVDTTLQNAKGYGGAGQLPVPSAQGVSRETPSVTTIPGSPARSEEVFNEAGYRKASSDATVGKLLAETKGGGGVLGELLGTSEPTRAEYTTVKTIPATPSRVSAAAGAPAQSPGEAQGLAQAPPNLSKAAVPPVKVSLPGYITGRGYPAVEKAKAALERADRHPVDVAELTKEVEAGVHGAHAQIVAQTPKGVVVKPQPGAPSVFLPGRAPQKRLVQGER